MSPLAVVGLFAVGMALGSVGTVALLLWLPTSTAVQVAVERMAWQGRQTQAVKSIRDEVDQSSQRLIDEALAPDTPPQP